MQLKTRDSHLTCKVANKCLNVLERVEVVEWNKRWSPPFPCCPENHQSLKENPDRKKIKSHILLHLNYQDLQFFDILRLKFKLMELDLRTYFIDLHNFQYFFVVNFVLSYCRNHLFTSLPKSWFMRVRRICNYLNNSDKHTAQFVKHFCRRSYSETKLQAICENVHNMLSEELLCL